MVEYKNNKDIKLLYRNNGMDIRHYSSMGNNLLAKTISNRLEITEKGGIEIKN